MANKPAVAVKTVITTTVQSIGFTAEQVARLHGFAKMFADSELGILHSVKAVRDMIVPWNYERFECARTHWVTGYINVTQCTRDTADRAFGRFSSDWEDKPKSEAPKAVANAKVRDAKIKAVKAAIKKHGTSSALQFEAGQAMLAGKTADAEILTQAVKTAKSEEKAATIKALAPRWTAVVSKLGAARNVADLKTLEALEELLAVTISVTALPRAKKG